MQSNVVRFSNTTFNDNVSKLFFFIFQAKEITLTACETFEKMQSTVSKSVLNRLFLSDDTLH